MTTGRINQVTIVRRGWPSTLSFRVEEIFSYRYSGPIRYRATTQQGLAGPDLPGEASTFPLSIPQSAVDAYKNSLTGVKYGLSAPRGGHYPKVQLFSVPRGWVSPDALV